MRFFIYAVAIAASQLCSTNLIAQPKEPFIVSASVLDKNLAKVTDSLYAYKYETSNTEYRQFLKSIREKVKPCMYFISGIRWAGIRLPCGTIWFRIHGMSGILLFPNTLPSI
jgi:hypothetical protein